MTPPQQQVVRLQPRSAPVSHKVQLIYKLFVLENAKRALEHKLNDFINKAYDDVQAFSNSSFPTSGFIDLANALDAKCQAVDRLSALLKDLTVETQVCVQQAVKIKVRTHQLQPLGDKGILMTDVLKFGPMLQNGLMASSIAKAVQVLRGTVSHQQLKHFLISQPAAAQEDNMISSISSIQTPGPICHLKGKEKEQTVISEEKSQPNVVSLLPAVIQTPENTAERPPLLVPASVSNSESVNVTPKMSWEWEDVQVQHQKQTSSQLLQFLRAWAKNKRRMGALEEVTVVDWNKSMHNSCLPHPSPTIKTQNYQFRNIVLDDLMGSPAQKTLRADIENHAPVFRVKQVELSGSLTYTCVIATKTELWDIGDIFTEVQQAHTVSSPVKNEDCQNITAHVENSCVNIQRKTQTSQCTEPERENISAGAKTPVINSVTIPKFQVRRFEEIEVVVSHAVSPGDFYIQHADSFTKLQGLITDSWKASRSYAEQNCIPDIGTQVMGWFAKREQWRRAQVTKICGVSGENNNFTDGPGCETTIQVEVKWLDQGDTACLSLLNIKRLTAEMAVLPLQALQVSLVNVTPVNGTDWSEEAVGWFKAMVHNRTFYARLYPAGPKVTVELFLERGRLGAMRNCGNAFCKDCCCLKPPIYDPVLVCNICHDLLL